MNTFRILSLLLIIFTASAVSAQELTQTIRGIVVDKVSQSPLPGATVIIPGSQPLTGTATDANGNFRLEKIPVGKVDLLITFMGYEDAALKGINVNSGKEVILRIELAENIITGKEVVVTATVDREKPVNELSVVSARSFTVEETQKYAAAINDPGRMATSFSGVVSTDDGNNMISVRGNAPNGILWRMEGVEIPNPNHFANPGTSAGGVSILSAQLLGNSDFLTGAFAAEYGNALSGVFDLRLRRGNNEKREHTFQAGVLGIDAATEGPFKKGYGGSYLVNYRYSTLDILDKIGVNITGGSLHFQDLSYNVILPAGKAGNFSVFGFAGLSNQISKAKKDTSAWETNFDQLNANFYANTYMNGLTHTILTGNSGNLRTVVALSGNQLGYKEEKLDSILFNPTLQYDEIFHQNKVTLSSIYTHKFNARHSMKGGVILNHLNYQLRKNALMAESSTMERFMDMDGNTQTAQGFAHYTFRATEKLSLHGGVHYLQLMLNNTWSVEPRASIKYEFNDRHAAGMGYGLHSQIQPIGVYFSEFKDATGKVSLFNKDLDLTKSHHLVAFYDLMAGKNLHFKTEVYYQSLYDIPVSPDPSSSLAIINNQYGFVEDSLVNEGIGRNYGVELTAERFLSNGLYFILSGSVYQSEYQAKDGIWRNTRYNGNFATTFTGGKEFELGGKKDRWLGLNLKTIYVGGQRYTPLDKVASVAQNQPVFLENKAFEPQNPNYFRSDVRISLKTNRKKSTTTLALDIQNATNRENVGGQYYDEDKKEVLYWYQTSLIPVLSYKIEF